LIVIVWLFEFAHAVVFSDVNPFWLRGFYVVVMALLFSFVVWLLALLSPELWKTIFEMLGFRDKEEKDYEDKT
jgi:hypothetical protein